MLLPLFAVFSVFADRTDAGKQLATALSHYQEQQELYILGLPRGGIPVAFEVAKSLKAPLDAFLVKKLGIPGQEEVAFGAIAAGNITYLNNKLIKQIGITKDSILKIKQTKQEILAQKNKIYRNNAPLPNLKNKTIILIDDGMATGSTLKAAINSLKQCKYKKLVVAIPVAPADSIAEIESQVDELICLNTPSSFMAVGNYFKNFAQTTDDIVCDLLDKAKQFS